MIKVNEPWLPNKNSLIEITKKEHFYVKTVNSNLSVYSNQIENVSQSFIKKDTSPNLFDIQKSLINMKLIDNWLS